MAERLSPSSRAVTVDPAASGPFCATPEVAEYVVAGGTGVVLPPDEPPPLR